jgi:general secretion pathway protein J
MRMRQPGFTLVEVLVALVVMALLAALSWQGVDGIARTRQLSQAKLDEVLRLSTGLAQWEQDLQSVQETHAVPALAFDGATVRLTRRTDDGIQLVLWALRDGSLWRWAGRPVGKVRELQDQWFASQQFQGNEPGQLRVLPRVTGWQLYFYRDNSWTNPQSTGALPTGVRLVMTLTEGGSLSGGVTRDISLSPHLP